MQSDNLMKRWKLPLSQHTGRPEGDILEDGLLSSDFPNSSVHIVFEEGSDLTFRHAFYLGDVDKRIEDKSICRVAVFTEHVGYHEFWIGPEDRIEVVMPKKENLGNLLAHCDPNSPRSPEEIAWDNMAPLGREFGSPDYDRLVEKDGQNLKANLIGLIEKCSKTKRGTLEGWQIDEAINVQKALHELGQKVTITTAATVWLEYSQSMMANWLAGADTVQSAKKTLLFYCSGHPSLD